MAVDLKKYSDLAQRRISVLKTRCRAGDYSAALFSMVENGLSSLYPLESLVWMKDYLSHPNQNIATGCLKCLCRHGMKISEAEKIALSRMKDRLFSCCAIDMAEMQGDADFLLNYMNEDDFYVNRVILALKKLGKDTYLTSLMFSENELTVDGVLRVLDSAEQKDSNSKAEE